MAIDSTSPRTRRAILIGALGGAAAAVAVAAGRANPVSAADGQTVLVGHAYSATSVTEFDASGGAAGLRGKSESGHGVYGSSVNQAKGSSAPTTPARVSKALVTWASGSTAAAPTASVSMGGAMPLGYPALLGQSGSGNTGVQGYSGDQAAPTSPPRPASTATPHKTTLPEE